MITETKREPISDDRLARATDLAGRIHDEAHEAACLVDMDGRTIGWAPEDSIPIIARHLVEFVNREERIERAKRAAPQNAVEQREGLALGELVMVNADMLALLQEDNTALRAEIERLKAELKYADGELCNLRADRKLAAEVLAPIGPLVGFEPSELGCIGLADAIKSTVTGLTTEASEDTKMLDRDARTAIRAAIAEGNSNG